MAVTVLSLIFCGRAWSESEQSISHQGRFSHQGRGQGKGLQVPLCLTAGVSSLWAPVRKNNLWRFGEGFGRDLEIWRGIWERFGDLEREKEGLLEQKKIRSEQEMPLFCKNS